MKKLIYFYAGIYNDCIILRDPENKHDDIIAKTKEEALKKARAYYNVSRIKLERAY